MGWGIAVARILQLRHWKTSLGGGERGGLSHVLYLIRCIRIIIMAELGKDHPKSGGPGVDIRGSA